MKSYVIAILLVLIIFMIGGNANSSSNTSASIKKMESYQACLKVKEKVHINLKCEKLIEIERDSENVKVLPKAIVQTRKVNKKEEIKIRDYLHKLSSEF